MVSETFRRTGFWRRLGAFAIDALCVAVPCSLLGGLFFGASGGTVQMASPGLRLHACQSVATYPDDLSPAPPDGSNFATVCNSYFLAGQTGRVLTVGSRVRESSITTVQSVSYSLDAQGRAGRSIDVSWITPLAFLGYILFALHRFRRTIGLRLVSSHMILVDNAEAERIPLGRLLLRFAILFAGFIPAIAVAGLTLIAVLGGGVSPLAFVAGVVGAWILGAAWWLWNIVLIARKRDPVYDRVARVAVVRNDRSAATRP